MLFLNLVICSLVKILIVVVPLIVSIAYLTLAERKVLAAIQLRKRPNVVRFYGLIQPLADGLKLVLKETIIPSHANYVIFLLAPVVCLTLALVGWVVIPFGEGLVISDLNIGILYLFAVSSLGIYAVLCSGWASNSKYAFLGSLRSTAQMISYEVSIGLILISLIIVAGTLNLTELILIQESVWFIFPFWPCFLMFYVSSLAETNRPPFDLPESESELVSGYNVEYSSITFALFFLGEYCHIILMSVMSALVFLGRWVSPLGFVPFIWLPDIAWLVVKSLLVSFRFLWVRSALPRMRFDQLMYLCWKSYLPLSLAIVLFTSGLLVGFDCYPSMQY